MVRNKTYDVAIVGAGPAGLVAALNLARHTFSVALFGTFPSQLAEAARVENWPGGRPVSGTEILKNLRARLEQWPQFVTYHVSTEVKNVARARGGFSLETNQATYRARSVLVATGVRRRRLGVPGEARLAGAGLSYCVACDAPFFSGKNVVLAANGSNALEKARKLADFARHVWLVEHEPGDGVKGSGSNKHGNITLLGAAHIQDVLGDKIVNGIRFKQGSKTEELAVQGVFVELGKAPANDPVRSLVQTDDGGFILTDAAQATSYPGVFAAGDATSQPIKQAAVAAGDATKAAFAISDFLMKGGR